MPDSSLWQRRAVAQHVGERPGIEFVGGLVGAENLCHQAIFMNHTSGAVTLLNPDVVHVGDAVGQRAQWRGLLEGALRPVGIVKVFVVV
jgi:hypothetical protein